DQSLRANMPKMKKYRKRNTGTLGKKKVRSKKLKNLRMSDHYLNREYFDHKVNTPHGRKKAIWKTRWNQARTRSY
ncbi:MAG TPA: hypothetical protein PLD99_01565, partial [Parcubacteria group bacterium]|nr:hypothetical protein [Parcubacteria group bacterium]